MQKHYNGVTHPRDYDPFYIRGPLLDEEGTPMLDPKGNPVTVLRAYDCFFGNWSTFKTPGQSKPPRALTCEILVDDHMETIRVTTMYGLQCVCFKRPANAPVLIFTPEEQPEEVPSSKDVNYGTHPETCLRFLAAIVLVCFMCSGILVVTLIAGILLCALAGDSLWRALRSEKMRLMLCALLLETSTNCNANMERIKEVCQDVVDECICRVAKLPSKPVSSPDPSDEKPAVCCSESS